MIVWGIDPSSNCGLAIYDTERHISAVHCEVLTSEKDWDYYFYSVQMGRKLRERINRFGLPDLIVIEQGSESSQGTGVNGLIWIWNVIGAIVSVIGIYGVPIAIIHPATWRKPFYGKHFQCPQKPVMESVVINGVKTTRQVIEKGKPKFKNDWKTAATDKCTELGVTYPTQKTIAHNACEAVGMAYEWHHATVINKEFYDAFQAMLKQRNERAPAGDLFQGGAA